MRHFFNVLKSCVIIGTMKKDISSKLLWIAILVLVATWVFIDFISYKPSFISNHSLNCSITIPWIYIAIPYGILLYTIPSIIYFVLVLRKIIKRLDPMSSLRNLMETKEVKPIIRVLLVDGVILIIANILLSVGLIVFCRVS